MPLGALTPAGQNVQIPIFISVAAKGGRSGEASTRTCGSIDIEWGPVFILMENVGRFHGMLRPFPRVCKRRGVELDPHFSSSGTDQVSAIM